MTNLNGTFDTPNAPKYLQQLCKHFGHKVEAQHDDTTGTVALGVGLTSMQADGERLTIDVALNDVEEAETAKHIIDAHLKRFAFREEFDAMDWSMS